MEASRIMSHQISWHCGSDNFTHKINHYIVQNIKTYESVLPNKVLASMGFYNQLLNLFLFSSVQKISYLSLLISFLSHSSRQTRCLEGVEGCVCVCVCAHMCVCFCAYSEM